MLRFVAWIPLLAALGCVRLDPDHCANQDDPIAYCMGEYDATVRFCSRCRASDHGCFDEAPEPACDAAPIGATTASGTTVAAGSTSTGDASTSLVSSSGSSTTTVDTGSDTTGEPPLPVCGDGVKNTQEETCDGSDLDGVTTCMDAGFEPAPETDGLVACYGPEATANLRCHYDFTQCVGTAQCGNGVIEGNEQCDGDNLDDETCESVNATFVGGTLSCNPSGASSPCTFNTSECTPCGVQGADCGEGLPACCAGLNLGCGALSHTCSLL